MRGENFRSLTEAIACVIFISQRERLHQAQQLCRTSDATRRFRERLKALGVATLTSCRHGEFKCQPTTHLEPSSSEITRFCQKA